jgi:hypothetical protein
MTKKLVVIAVLVGALASGATAHSAPTLVFPTGSYPTDVENVQAAADLGGTVILKARSAAGVPTAFDFGPPQLDSGAVELGSDVAVVGERVGSARTTIEGGYYPLRTLESITVSVRAIDFVGPLHGALFMVGPEGSRYELTENRIEHVVGRLFECCGTFGEAIVVGGGRVLVADNVVNGVDAESGIAISEFDSTGKVEILRNRVSGTSIVGIECTRNTGVVKIIDNIVRAGPTSHGFGGYGIEINGTGTYHVDRNDIVLETPGGEGILALGMQEFGFGPMTDPIIERNRVVLRPVGDVDGELLNDAIDLAGLVSGAAVRRNVIDGPGYWAFGLFPIVIDPENPNADESLNRIVDNDIARFEARLVDVFLDTSSHDNLVKGRGRVGTAIDLGTDNEVVGFSLLASAATAEAKAQVRDHDLRARSPHLASSGAVPSS